VTDATFHLFTYGTLGSGGAASELLEGCERVAAASVQGTLYDVGEFPALLLSGSDPVPGEIWRCPAELLPGIGPGPTRGPAGPGGPVERLTSVPSDRIFVRRSTASTANDGAEMALSATDLSMVFLGILIIMVLLEVRKLTRKPEPVSRLEEQFERLSQQMERIRPADLELPGGAQLVEAGRTFETISEQLERLGESADELDTALLTEDGVRRFTQGLQQLRDELATAQTLFETAARGLGNASDSMLAAGSALQRVDSHLETVMVPAARQGRGGAPAARNDDPSGSD
jgi:prefoldin subunit 5